MIVLNHAKIKKQILFTKSINLQLQSDANLGVQLSGGIELNLNY